MNARKLVDTAAWLLAALAILWLGAWGYVNNFAGDQPAEWTRAFQRFHQPLWNALPFDMPPAFALLAVAIGAALYFLPTYIASTRRAPNIGAIAGINVLFGWTILGWLGALVWAVTDRR